jgi:hypothetical protein
MSLLYDGLNGLDPPSYNIYTVIYIMQPPVITGKLLVLDYDIIGTRSTTLRPFSSSGYVTSAHWSRYYFP